MDCRPEELPAPRYERKSRRNSAPRLDRIVLKAREPGSSPYCRPPLPLGWKVAVNTLAFIGTAAFAMAAFLAAFVLLEGREPAAGPVHGMMGAAIEMEMKR